MVSPSNGHHHNHGFGGKWREVEDLNKDEKPTLLEDYSGSETADSLMSSTPMAEEGMIMCSQQAQESLDNVLIDLYKKAGRIDEHIELLQHKLQLIEDDVTYGGKRTKIARAQGKKYLCSIEQEKSRLLGNLGWAYTQQEKYQVAEELLRKALSIEPDNNKECNLAICLMHKGKIIEAKSLLQTVKPSIAERELADSYIKSYNRATEMLSELDSGTVLKPLEQKKDDNIKLETQGSFTSAVNSQVSSRYGDQENNALGVELADSLKHQASYIHRDHQSHMVGLRGLELSDSRVSCTTNVQQIGIRRCLDNSHPRVLPLVDSIKIMGSEENGERRIHGVHPLMKIVKIIGLVENGKRRTWTKKKTSLFGRNTLMV
ncbi:hypothetical protein MKX01_022947 [Papaver californicum]|nr:hypothetical protein MKX01_022947 [Papaver californicum]